jgi:hypothetical protein
MPRGSLGVRELQSTFQLGLQDEVFSGQIFVPHQQLLVHRPRPSLPSATMTSAPFESALNELPVCPAPKKRERPVWYL